MCGSRSVVATFARSSGKPRPALTPAYDSATTVRLGLWSCSTREAIPTSRRHLLDRRGYFGPLSRRAIAVAVAITASTPRAGSRRLAGLAQGLADRLIDRIDGGVRRLRTDQDRTSSPRTLNRRRPVLRGPGRADNKDHGCLPGPRLVRCSLWPPDRHAERSTVHLWHMQWLDPRGRDEHAVAGPQSSAASAWSWSRSSSWQGWAGLLGIRTATATSSVDGYPAR